MICDDVYTEDEIGGFSPALELMNTSCGSAYRDGTLWTYGDHASGDDSGACYDDDSILGGLGMSTVFGDYAWYSGNSGAAPMSWVLPVTPMP